MAQVSTYPADTLDDTDKILGSTSLGAVKNFAGSQFAKLNTEDQALVGGASVTAKSLPAGNITVDPGARPLQYITNNGAFTITAPAADGSCMLLITNGATAGSVTFSGFSTPVSVGDSLNTVNGDKFTISIWRINGVAGYRIAAHQ